ncbi:MAG: hypothetical protein HYS27_07380 [Deltaproteobacteria bacterium]|nr:hypothetical protein [Deltaproteobacteria bacterium]
MKSVGGAIKHKVSETFGEGREPAPDEALDMGTLAPALDGPAARRVLGVKDDASLADVREAYRRLAQAQFARARREGPDSAAAHLLDRALLALELLEEELLPLGAASPGGASAGAGATPPTSRRKRATPRT